VLRFVDHILEELCTLCLELCPCYIHDLKISFQSTARSHFGPYRDCTVDDARPPNQTFASSSLFMKVTFRLAFTELAQDRDNPRYSLTVGVLILSRVSVTKTRIWIGESVY
jgi:hypothetical protein